MRPFRFGHQLRATPDTDVIASARRAEEIGFDVVLVPDHLGRDLLAPMPTLATIAAATTTIRLGTFVLNAEMRNPVQLAWEASSLDRLSGGRFELGLGAGHTPHEFAAAGIEFSSPSVRKHRLTEQVEALRRLLDGDTVTAPAGHVQLIDAEVIAPVQEQLPILVGGNGAHLLSHAGAHADIVGLQGLGRTLEDGHRHEVDWTAEHLDRQIAQVRAGAGDRFAEVELNALVQVVEITDDAHVAVARLCEEVPTLDPAHVHDVPYVLIGSVEEIVAKLHRCRERWGISYFAVRVLDDFAPVIAACR